MADLENPIPEAPKSTMAEDDSTPPSPVVRTQDDAIQEAIKAITNLASPEELKDLNKIDREIQRINDRTDEVKEKPKAKKKKATKTKKRKKDEILEKKELNEMEKQLARLRQTPYPGYPPHAQYQGPLTQQPAPVMMGPPGVMGMPGPTHQMVYPGYVPRDYYFGQPSPQGYYPR